MSPHPANARNVGGSISRALPALLGVVLLASCSAGAAASRPSATGTPTATPTLTPASTPTPTETATSASVAAHPSSEPGAGQAMDPTGDLVDESGQPTDGPDYVDLIALAATTDGTQLNLRIGLAGTPPEANPIQEEVVIGCYVDTNADGDPEYSLIVSNIAARGPYSASLVDLNSGDTLAGPDFPGTAAVNGNIVTLLVPLSNLGGQVGLQVAAYTQWTYFPDPVNQPNASQQAADGVPEPTWPSDDSAWLSPAQT